MPEAGRADYNSLIRFNQVDPGEPVFMIRGKDALAAAAVRGWAALAFDAGVAPAVVEAALVQADLLEHYGPKKLPDAEHLAPQEAQQLEFELSRRAWNANLPRSADTLLAERRGFDAAGGLNRTMQSALQQLVDTLALAEEIAAGRKATLQEKAKMARALHAGRLAIGRVDAAEATSHA